MHSGAIVEPRKFRAISNVLQVCGNPEYRVECVACSLSAISIKQESKELNYVVLHVGFPVRRLS